MASGTTSLKLDPKLKERVERVAKSYDRSAHWVMKHAIEEYVERAESDEEFRRRAEASWEHYEQTGLHLTHEEVMEWLERRSRGEDPPMPKVHT